MVLIGAVIVAGLASSSAKPCEPGLGSWCNNNQANVWLVLYFVVTGILYAVWLWRQRVKGSNGKDENQDKLK